MLHKSSCYSPFTPWSSLEGQSPGASISLHPSSASLLISTHVSPLPGQVVLGNSSSRKKLEGVGKISKQGKLPAASLSGKHKL